MFTSIRTLTLSAVALALLAGGTAVLAQGPGGPGPRGPRAAPRVVLRGLDLTEAQREQARVLVAQYREAGGAAREALAQAREARREALAALPLDDDLIRSTTQALVGAETEVAIAQARLRADVLALLTPEQAQELESRQAARAEGRQERGERVGERREERRERRQRDAQ